MAATGTQIENSVAQAIKIIADQRIENLKLDKTVRAVVDRHLGNGYYALIYNGGLMYAYAEDNVEFVPGASVYVLVPQGNFDERKRILGRTSAISVNNDAVVVEGGLDEYAIIGNNLIQVKDLESNNRYASTYPFGLNTYNTPPVADGTQSEYQECKVLYDVEQLDNSCLTINTSNLYNYMQDAKGFMLAADFETVLDSEQVKGGSVGNYGLAITIKTKNTSAKYSIVQEEWNSLEPATQFEYNDEILRLNNFKNEIVDIWKDEDISLNECQNEILKIAGDLESFILAGRDRIDKDALTLCQNYHDFLMELTTYTVNTQNLPLTVKDLEQIHSEWFADAIANSQYQTFTYQYTLDTLNMIGDPYNFKQKSRQYIINRIDAENFAGIEGIYFFCQNFDPTNGGVAPHDINTVFVSNIQFYCLKEATKVNGDYKLDVNTPQGANFKTNSEVEVLPVTYTVIYKKYQNITSRCTATWFQQDVNITDNTQVGYNALAGAGWRQLVKGVTETGCTINAKQCSSYKNEFLCVVTSNLECVAKQQFTIFNDANHHDIEIVSDSGSSFGFSAKAKTLTCFVDNSASNFSVAIPDEQFKFVWSKDGYVFTETEEEIKAKLSNDNLDITLRQDLKNQLAKVQGITFNKNVLVFPSSQIDPLNPVIVKCTVQVKDDPAEENYYTIGEAEIVLTQVSTGTLKGYYIEIENSSQVFQYNEAGVSPCSERYEQPYKPLPLSCKFYSPGGGIISEDKYTVKWQWPINNTLLLIDDEIAIENPSTNEKDLYIQSTCPINIVEDYSYNTLNNQILCIVDFENMTYTKSTNFYFGKVGENGTNGTDIVAKIVPLAESTNTALLKEPLTLCINEADPADVRYAWNTGAGLTDPILKLMLYKRNDLIDSSEYQLVKWSIAGNNASSRSRMSIQSSIASNGTDAIASITWNTAEDFNFEKSNYIVRGQAGLNIKNSRKENVVQKYYYYYPIPVIKQHKDNMSYSVGIDKEKTMRQVLYNKDGRNPQYNKNLGVRLIFDSDQDIETRVLKWSVIGGPNETILETSSLRINDINSLTYQSEYQSDSAVQTAIDTLNKKKQKLIEDWEGTEEQQGAAKTLYNNWTSAETEANKESAFQDFITALNTYNKSIARIDAELASLKKGADAFVKIVPTDTYTGAYNNNCVKVEIGTTSIDSQTEEEVFDLEYTVIVPIHLSLNVYGLASLNSWDGNAVEIDEDKKYVLAPQVGAGIKNPEDNTFTGILIGQEETYNGNETESNLGLLGYSHGKQSIFLDAETGNATFGLPESDAISEGNILTEGRIELRPGGISKIAKWNFDARSLYRVASKIETEAIGTKSVTTYTQPNPPNRQDYDLLAAPYKSIQYNTETHAWSAAAPKDAHGSVPHDQQGILLSALPTYVSFKGRPWKTGEFDPNEINNLISEGDSFEVEIDPNNKSLFTIYVHTRQKTVDPVTNEITYGEWYRVPKVGIDNMGRFYTQSIRDEGTSSFVGPLGGFGVAAYEEDHYVGAAYSFDGVVGEDKQESQALIKFMTNSKNIGSTSPLYISSYGQLNKLDKQTGEIINLGDEGTRPIGVYGGEYINLYAGDNDNQISPIKTTAIKLNHNPGNNENNEPSNYSIQLIAQTDSANDSSNRAELLLNQTANGSGLLYHNRPWNTTINGAYTGNFDGIYTETHSNTTTYTFTGLVANNLTNGLTANIGTTTGNIIVNYRGSDQNSSNQSVTVSPSSFIYNQKNTATTPAVINRFELTSDGILLQNNSQKKVIIGQDSKNSSYAINDSQYTAAKMQIKSVGADEGLSLYAEGSGNNSSYVGMKFIPNGSNAGFYLNASGQTVNEIGVISKGAYINSYYNDSLLNGDLPFYGVQVGPKLHTKALYVDQALSTVTSSILNGVGIYAENDIKAGSISLKNHTHSFSKGVTVKIQQKPSGNPSSSITQGGVGSNAIITVDASINDTHYATYTGGDYNGGTIHFRVIGDNLQTYSGIITIDSNGDYTVTGDAVTNNSFAIDNISGFTVSTITAYLEGSCSLNTGSVSETVTGVTSAPN